MMGGGAGTTGGGGRRGAYATMRIKGGTIPMDTNCTLHTAGQHTLLDMAGRSQALC